MAKTPWILTREMFLDEQELDQLLAGLQQQRTDGPADQQVATRLDQLIVASLALSGLRNSELCKLAVRDFDAAPRCPAFHITGSRESRVVHLPKFVGDLVRDYLRSVRPKLLPQGIAARDDRQPLFLSERRKRFDRTALYRRVVAILSRFGLESRASVQLLRHTYGYIAYQRTGRDLLFVQRQLGHAHPMVTAIYDQFVERDHAAIANRLIPEAT